MAGDLVVSTINGGAIGTKNRIINGDMRIDQRNNGTAVTFAAGVIGNGYAVDRWTGIKGTAGAYTMQRSNVAPPGYTNSLLVTVNTTMNGATDFAAIRQGIEGFNVADLGWGTATAQTVTISFWIRCSIAGTFNWSLLNGAENRGYVSAFTINAPNTWEYKTLVVPGPTTGTWLTDNGNGIRLMIDLGTGTTYSTTAGSWQAFDFAYGLTGGTKLMANAGATLNITGVQLEAGSVATPFERRPYGTELMLCQRYFQQLPSNRTSGDMVLSSPVLGGSDRIPLPVLPVLMRAIPTVVSFRSNGTTTGETTEFSSGTNRVVTSIPNVDACGGGYMQCSTSFSNACRLNLTYSAEL